MQIKYVGGTETVFIRDITDPRFNAWAMNEVKEVPDYDIDVLDAYGLGNRRNAIAAVFNAGKFFVDAASGKNPLWSCAVKGCDRLADHDFFRPDGELIEYVDDAGDKLCVAHFLVAHPEHLKYHVDRGLPYDTRRHIDELNTAAAPTLATSPPPKPEPIPQTPTPVDVPKEG
jgi:hypothetical protein